jgi:hypothetical protein
MKCMTESRGNDLCERRTLRADRIRDPTRLHLELAAANAGEMREFVNHGALLRNHQQQQEA